MELNSKYLMSKNGIELLTKLFYSSGEGIIFFDSTSKILALNPRAESMFGYSENELIGKFVEELVPAALRNNHTKVRSNYMKHPTPRQMGIGRDLIGVRKNASEFPLEVSLSFLEDQGQKMVVAFVTDITQRKENEKKLEEYTSQLELKVKERTNELEHLNLGLQSQIQERKIAEEALKESLEELKKAEKEILQSLEKEKELNELKSRFVSMASHEFRTPLTTVLSSANLIAKYSEKDQQEAREKHIDRIRKNVHNLTTILNDFLSIEKLESGAQKTEKENVQLSGLISEVIEEMNLTLKIGQAIKFEGVEMEIKTDPHILRNILINLISNASKYSEEDQSISIKTSINKDHIVIDVIDQGLGIPEEEQKNMFQRFFRAGNVINIQGTGLGLTIVKKYAELLDGVISFKSTVGKGSTFTLEIPG